MLTGTPLLLLILSSIVLIIALTAKFKAHPFLALVIASFYVGLAGGVPLMKILDAMQGGFGGLMSYIGLIVIFGSIIGVYLEKSGGALSIANRLMKMIGERRIVPGISSIGALVSIPVFCDSGFILLSGLTDKLSHLSKESKATLSLALGTGLYTTHTLIPPTPGPIAAAGNIGATDYLGTMIIVGFLISIPVLIISNWWARRLGRNIVAIDHVEEKASTDIPEVIATWKALIPLLLPILLIALGTVLKFLKIESEILSFICAPITSIFIGAVSALILLGQKTKNIDWVKEAIKVSGPILIITGAGGAFGGVLKATPLKEYIGTWLSSDYTGILILIFLFIIAAVLKSAQGSSTSAMVITSSLLAPMVPGLGWDEPIQYALAVAAIGGGSMTVSHFNDSYFWVVSQFSGISAKDAARSFTILTGIQGITVLVMCLLAWVILV